MNIKFALDVTWVRHKIVGGTESFTHNLLQGFMETKDIFSMYLIAALDNEQYFRKYEEDDRIHLIIAPVNSASVPKRIIWQNLYLSHFLKRNGIGLCLEPVYAKPFFNVRGINFITVIHDLEALHFPENHSWMTNVWLRLSWINTVRTSEQIVCISNFVRQDILDTYKISGDNLTTIYDPITIDVSDKCDFARMKMQYGINPGEYYYTVSKLNPHKNLVTLVKVFGEIKKKNIHDIPCKLVISGVNGGMEEELRQVAKSYSLTDELVLTGFVENNVRNCLYSNCKAFLFPSVFEGFGMPLVEAISSGVPVVTTNMVCIPEITQNAASYVENPYSIDEWIEKIKSAHVSEVRFDDGIYKPDYIARQYLVLLEKCKTKRQGRR